MHVGGTAGVSGEFTEKVVGIVVGSHEVPHVPTDFNLVDLLVILSSAKIVGGLSG